MPKAELSRRSLLKSAVAGAAASVGGFQAAESRGAEERTSGSEWQRPPHQSGNGLNLIVIVADTFRADNLACYGPK